MTISLSLNVYAQQIESAHGETKSEVLPSAGRDRDSGSDSNRDRDKNNDSADTGSKDSADVSRGGTEGIGGGSGLSEEDPQAQLEARAEPDLRAAGTGLDANSSVIAADTLLGVSDESGRDAMNSSLRQAVIDESWSAEQMGAKHAGSDKSHNAEGSGDSGSGDGRSHHTQSEDAKRKAVSNTLRSDAVS